MRIRISRKRVIGGCVVAGLGAVALGPGFASASADATFSVSVTTASSDFNLGPYDLVVACEDGSTFVASLHVGQSSAFGVPKGQPMDCQLEVDPTIEQQAVLRLAIGDAVDPSDGHIAASSPSRIAQEGREFVLQVDAEAVPVKIETQAPYLDDSHGPFAVELACEDGFSEIVSMNGTDSATILLPGGIELDCGAEVIFAKEQQGEYNANYRDDLGPSNGRLAPGQLAAVTYAKAGEDMVIYIAITEQDS